MFQDFKIESTTERSTPTTISRHIQSTFENKVLHSEIFLTPIPTINFPSKLTNTYLHNDDYINDTPTKYVRSNFEKVLTKENMNENVINESLNDNKETTFNEYTIGNNPRTTETTRNNYIVNSFDKGYIEYRNERIFIKNNQPNRKIRHIQDMKTVKAITCKINDVNKETCHQKTYRRYFNTIPYHWQPKS